ncbi:MAG TPA: VOC family protein [Candidatus Saccharimonadales bacterium]|nr:VOC family protein [Candidatus Saccharimonadales bacterium]
MSVEFTDLGIHIKVKDIVKSREFYEGLGFVPVFGYGDDAFRATLPDGCGSASERYHGVTYNLTETSQLEIADGHIAVKPETFGEEIASAKISGMVKVKSLLPLVDKLKSYMKYPVKKYYWGTIEIAVRDPDGFVLIFIAPHSDEEYDALSKVVGDIEIVQPGK